MFLTYGLTFFCETMLYLGGLGCLGMLQNCRPGLFWVPALLLAAACLSGILTGRGSWWLRYAPMAAVAPCLFLPGNRAGVLAALPMLAYLPLYVYNNRRATDYDYAVERFRHSLIAAAFLMLLALAIQSPRWTDGLPWLFLYFSLSITLLRLLRHDDRVARARSFQALNIAGVLLVCGAGFALSQPRIIAAVRLAWGWFCENVLLRLAVLVLYLLQLAFYLIARLVSLLLPGIGDGAMPELPSALPGEGSGMFAPQIDEVRALPPFVRFALQAVGFAIATVLVFLVLRALAQRIGRDESASGTDERESLDRLEAPRPRGPLLRRSPGDGVRLWYRRALALIRARGGRVEASMNTLQIEQANGEAVNPDALRALREVYLPVRYGGRVGSRGDATRARAAYERLKKIE
ncbi:MAG: DUF4129 domain-containing protein [Clostridia bacterium]|nr:DUF4129 domain-containing protein [Clostridia bacterium]